MTPVIVLWSAIGFGAYLMLTDDPYPSIDTDAITIPQAIMLRFLCGPIIWVYGLWRLLGLWGKHS